VPDRSDNDFDPFADDDANADNDDFSKPPSGGSDRASDDATGGAAEESATVPRAGTTTQEPGNGGEPAMLGAAMPISPADTKSKRRNGDGGPKKRRPLPAKTILIVAVVAILLLAVVPAFASGLKKTPRNKIGISYGGGPIEGAHYQRIVKPGHALFFNGFFDPLYLYPADQQSYIISLKKSEGSTNIADSVTAPTKDRVQMVYQVAIYFKLDTDRLRDFHEQIGLKYAAYTNSGWQYMITSTFRQQIENALQQETRRYTVQDIYGSEAVLLQLQDHVQSSLTQRLKAALGEQFFCGPTWEPGEKCGPVTFTIKRADPPKSVVASLEAQRNSQIGIQTAENNAQARAQEVKGIDDLRAAGISGSDYVLMKAVESGNINFWVLPQGNSLTLNTGTNGNQAPATPGSGSGGGSSSGSGSSSSSSSASGK
jgi:regulator of protease activity HflC (stomatin/prohibitin superfamily)